MFVSRHPVSARRPLVPLSTYSNQLVRHWEQHLWPVIRMEGITQHLRSPQVTTGHHRTDVLITCNLYLLLLSWPEHESRTKWCGCVTVGLQDSGGRVTVCSIGLHSIFTNYSPTLVRVWRRRPGQAQQVSVQYWEFGHHDHHHHHHFRAIKSRGQIQFNFNFIILVLYVLCII